MTGRARGAAFALVVGALASTAGAIDADIVALVRDMTIEEKVGQMTQIDISLVTKDGKLDRAEMRRWLRKYKVGSLLNSPYSGGACGDHSVPAGWTASEWRSLIHDVQQLAEDEGVPPILYGLDSVHGASYVYGATLFGHQIALGATFDREMARASGRVTARDTLAAGVPWLFAPILGLSTQPSWSRVYETFGEDPYLAAELGVANIEGIQSDTDDPDLPTAAACMKHFFAYSHPATGHDRAPVNVPERVLREYYLLPFEAAVKRAKVRTAMESYNEVNGVPIAASHKYLRRVLRDELGFRGMLVTDWAEIINLHEFHRVARSRHDAVHLAMNKTSIDMSMVPLDESFSESLVRLVSEGRVPIERVDESVERVMQLKKDLGLLARPVPARTSPLIERVGGDGELALEIARASIALLVNEEPMAYDGPKYCSPAMVNTSVSNGHDIKSFGAGQTPTAAACRAECERERSCERWLFMQEWLSLGWQVCFLKTEDAEIDTGPGHVSIAGYCEPGARALPLDPSTLLHVLVTGPTANSRVSQSGGWSIHWQGACDDAEFQGQGETITEALMRLLPRTTRVTHTRGCSFEVPSHAQATCEIDEADMERTLRAARTADVAIVAIGEESYTEKPGDIDDLSLHQGQLELVRTLAREQPSLSIVLVLIEGRPRLLDGITELPQVVGVLHGLLPGPAGGTAIAEIILGITNPSGRLPYTYPAFPHAFENHYSSVSSKCAGSASAYLSTGTENCPNLFEFGHGLSYTRFTYSNMRTLSGSANVTHPATITIMVDVNNTGSRAGRHTALLFASQDFRPDGTAPEKQRLVGFEALTLEPSHSKTVSFVVRTEQLAHVTEELHRVVDAGAYRFFFARQKHSPALELRVQTPPPELESGILRKLRNRALGVVKMGGTDEGKPASLFGIVMIVVSLTLTCFCAGMLAAVVVLRGKTLVGGAGYSRTSSVANMSTLNFLSSSVQASHHVNEEIASQPSEASGLDQMGSRGSGLDRLSGSRSEEIASQPSEASGLDQMGSRGSGLDRLSGSRSASYGVGMDRIGSSPAGNTVRVLDMPVEEGAEGPSGEYDDADEDLEMVDLRVRK
eukprot:CAMPEP_0119434146 /NCGR_PEP_ID=MMETSP1335-20130426/50521_1 /TAXON_ID=259385 /ORGANISM="Chrysoculter rhomboideus, Strain RCC1486" /LENGTH=1088 /DNA_ID=CAMNT_0007460001 /DNA_START=24 /DNA_END=3290 /DNA_ORIENTATION=+